LIREETRMALKVGKEIRDKTLNIKVSECELMKLRELSRETRVSEADVIRLLLWNGGPGDVLRVKDTGEIVKRGPKG
jgi:hypothetical protein